MSGWLLVVIMTSTIGFGAGEPTVFFGPKLYDDFDTCMKRGEKAALWLHQDFITVRWECLDDEARRNFQVEPDDQIPAEGDRGSEQKDL
jgi:hypothetical protein